MRHGLRVLTTVLIGTLVAPRLGAATAASAQLRTRDFGSAANLPLESPIAAFAPTPTGNGYWLTASDGGIFTYGDAHFHGSAGNIPLRAPIVAFAPTPTRSGGLWPASSDVGNGYWLAASDGGIFTYGDAHYFGSAFGLSSDPVVGMGASNDGLAYWLTTAGGEVFTFDAATHPRPAARRIPTRADPLRVLITGDSVAITLQDGLDTGLRSTRRARAIRRGRWCYGFTASWEPSPRKLFCAAAPQYAPQMLSDDIADTDPDAVVLMLGAWDWQGRRVGSRVLTRRAVTGGNGTRASSTMLSAASLVGTPSSTGSATQSATAVRKRLSNALSMRARDAPPGGTRLGRCTSTCTRRSARTEHCGTSAGCPTDAA